MAACPSTLERRIRFFEMLERGITPEAVVRENQEHYRRIVEQKVEELVQALLQRQRHAAELIAGYIGQLEAIRPIEAADEQNQFLSLTIQKLQEIQNRLIHEIEEGEKSLEEKQKEKEKLVATLHHFRIELRGAQQRGNPLRDFLFIKSEDLSKYISTKTQGSL